MGLTTGLITCFTIFVFWKWLSGGFEGFCMKETPTQPNKYPRATQYYREKYLRDDELENKFEYYDGYQIDVINEVNENALIRMAKDYRYAVEYYTDDTTYRKQYCSLYDEEEIKQKYDKLRCRAPFFEYCAKLCDERLEEMKQSNEEVG